MAPSPTRGSRTVDMTEDGSRDVTLDAFEVVLSPTDARIAIIEWRRDTGVIEHLWVDEAHRRQGLATMLYQHAQRQTDGFLKLSEWRTFDGQAWASTLGEPLPTWRLA